MNNSLAEIIISVGRHVTDPERVVGLLVIGRLLHGLRWNHIVIGYSGLLSRELLRIMFTDCFVLVLVLQTLVECSCLLALVLELRRHIFVLEGTLQKLKTLVNLTLMDAKTTWSPRALAQLDVCENWLNVVEVVQIMIHLQVRLGTLCI